MTLIDTHCHLNFNTFADDLNEVLQRASQAGVSRILVPGSDLPTSYQAVEMAERYPFIYAAVGIHPNDAHTWDANSLRQLEELARHPRVAAIGEIGLDYYRKHSTPEQQKQALHAQLELAAQINKPIILHSRQAFADLWSIITTWQEELRRQASPLTHSPGVFHAFEGNVDNALEVTRCGFCIGVGGVITYQNAAVRQAVAVRAPLDALLLETDAPFLTPYPHRGQRNEPAYLTYIAQKIAHLRQTSLQEVEHTTSSNANRLFNWRDL
ncbi:MAG: TatD family hydrolase [Anaerolineae bacterium]|nr:TatD family hydrolase [Anaerolineae bacterium]